MIASRAVAAWTVAGVLASAGAVVLLVGSSHGPAQPVPSSDGAAKNGDASPTDVGAHPVRLQIPSIGVDSSVMSLGQNADQSMQVPAPGPDYDRAGWYRYSPTPGSIGPAVIVGHVDSARTGPSVFYRLRALHSGDRVLVTGADRAVVAFTVTKLLQVPKAAFPSKLVYGDTRGSELRLITCGGAFDGRTGHYRDNVIVLATRTPTAGAA